MRPITRLLAPFFALSLLLGACGDDTGDEQTTDTLDETVDDVTDDIEEGARTAWASLRTNAERLIDEASTGDSEAQEQLLEECRDTLQELRESGDKDTDRVEQLCDDIRDAEDDADWDALRNEVRAIDKGRAG